MAHLKSHHIPNRWFLSSVMNSVNDFHIMECEVSVTVSQIQFSSQRLLTLVTLLAILVLYFRYVLLYSENTATQAFHIFAMACYFTPVLGAILADSFLGKFWTILSISIVYAVGNIVLSFASINGTV